MAGLPLLIIVKASKGSAICRLPIRFGVRGFPRPILDRQSQTMHDIPSSPTAQFCFCFIPFLLGTGVMGKAQISDKPQLLPHSNRIRAAPSWRGFRSGREVKPRKIGPKRLAQPGSGNFQVREPSLLQCVSYFLIAIFIQTTRRPVCCSLTSLSR